MRSLESTRQARLDPSRLIGMDGVVFRCLIHRLHELWQQLFGLSHLPRSAKPLDLTRDVFRGMLPPQIPLASLQVSAQVLFGRFNNRNNDHL